MPHQPFTEQTSLLMHQDIVAASATLCGMFGTGPVVTRLPCDNTAFAVDTDRACVVVSEVERLELLDSHMPSTSNTKSFQLGNFQLFILQQYFERHCVVFQHALLTDCGLCRFGPKRLLQLYKHEMIHLNLISETFD